jgi:4-amino-4-deoxy-L-arabinose transferase-like glycosyltransferase
MSTMTVTGDSPVAESARRRDPAWARPAFFGLLALTALLYLWNLSRNGYANDFYAAAVQAGTKSWKAFFFGSFDSSNFITVDKTPASLWVMELSARIFGFNSWSLLVPQALEGVGSVAVLYCAVRRWFGSGAALLAGLVLALTPAAALIFRFNNPDALLVLLMTAAGYCVMRAVERDRTRWIVLAGVLLGFAFLAKMMQAFLVVPGFALAYLWAGPARLRRRVWRLCLGLAGIVAGGGWWIVIAELTPAADRPYFGGSTNNDILQLAIGYNGLGRLDGSETGSIGGGGFGGATGPFRLFQTEFGGQISWLIPAALLSLGALAWVSRRESRTSRVRAFALVWGGWLLLTGVVFSYMQGIIHPYYMVALAPGVAALVGVGAMSLWEARVSIVGRWCTALGVLVTGIWAFVLLDRTPSWLPWLRWTVLAAGVIAAVLVLVPLVRGTRAGGEQARGGHARAGAPSRALAYTSLVFALVAGLGGPLAYSLDTVNTTHTGSIPSAGPQVAGSIGGGGAPGGGAPGGGSRGAGGGTRGAGGGAGKAGAPGGTRTGGGPGTGSIPGGAGGSAPSGTGHGTGGTGGTGGAGGLSGDTQVSSALVTLLETDASDYKWIAATEGSQEAAPIELATGGDAVMAIGGFNGTDPAPTLAEFEAMVAKHEIHYYIGGDNESFGGGTNSSAIASWVAAHFTSQKVGGVTVYNLTHEK